MMPVIFIGHGSPMNAIENNEYTKTWKKIADSIPKPVAILCISAHWTTRGTKISTSENPKTIHDFYGFPKELFDLEYKANGAPEIAQRAIQLLAGIAVEDNSWGIDHGTWSVLHRMYPQADIPVFQMSIDMQASPKELFEIGKTIKALRENNILIMGSGNVVHNLGRMNYSMLDGFDWANKFDDYIQAMIEERNFESIFEYKKLGDTASFSVPTTEHFYPLLFILGATDQSDKLTVYNKGFVAGSLSMTCYVFS